MQAIIPCAGTGTRLHPYTLERPKCLVEICNKPILDYQIEAIRSCDIHDITVVVGYMRDMMIDYCIQHNIQYIINDQFSHTNSLYSFMLCRPHIHDDILLLNGDLVINNIALAQLINYPQSTAVLVDNQCHIDPSEMNISITDGLVTDFSKTIPVHLAHARSMQVVKFSHNDIQLVMQRGQSIIDSDPHSKTFPPHAYDIVFKHSKMYPVYHKHGYCYEIDNPIDLRYTEDNLCP